MRKICITKSEVFLSEISNLLHFTTFFLKHIKQIEHYCPVFQSHSCEAYLARTLLREVENRCYTSLLPQFLQNLPPMIGAPQLPQNFAAFVSFIGICDSFSFRIAVWELSWSFFRYFSWSSLNIANSGRASTSLVLSVFRSYNCDAHHKINSSKIRQRKGVL